MIYPIAGVIAYLAISCGVAYWLGKYEPYGPPWGAIIWPILIPYLLIEKLLEYFNDLGQR